MRLYYVLRKANRYYVLVQLMGDRVQDDVRAQPIVFQNINLHEYEITGNLSRMLRI